jgi:N-glycosylase/DNA lyase
VAPSTAAEGVVPAAMRRFAASDYNLAATLTSGQAFRWEPEGPGWVGVIGRHWVRLSPQPGCILAQTAVPPAGWDWLVEYLQLEIDLSQVLAALPRDETMREALQASPGLRLLRQDPWECLASFILSSTKQIVQIRQIVGRLCRLYGEPVATPATHPPAHAFPAPTRLAGLTEADLRACKMGFRAPYLLEAAHRVADGALDLAVLSRLPMEEARQKLMELPGVGRKIADCVLLFACGFSAVFPIDVWLMKALQERYLARRRTRLADLHRFAGHHFGPYAGYAQQYLFHWMRTSLAAERKPERRPGK